MASCTALLPGLVRTMLQFLPVIVLLVTQNLVSQAGDAIPKTLASWLPMIAAVISYIVANKMQAAEQAKASAALLGKETPDFKIQFKDKATTMLELIKNSKRPTIVDFYQNF